MTPLTVWLGSLFVYFHVLDPRVRNDYGLGGWDAGICLALGHRGIRRRHVVLSARVEP